MITYIIRFPNKRLKVKANDLQAARECAIDYAHKHQLSFSKVSIWEAT